jgi:hypothetical protein
MVNDRIRASFPNIGEDARITSPSTADYNCVAWALGEADRWWEAGTPPGYYWPDGVPADHLLTSLIAALESVGFSRCENDELEPGFEKVALFEGDDTEYAHVSKQLPNGRWSSKLGAWEDIEHRLEALVGPAPAYGTLHCFMRRQRAT